MSLISFSALLGNSYPPYIDQYMTEVDGVLHPILSWFICILTVLLEIKCILTRFGCNF